MGLSLVVASWGYYPVAVCRLLTTLTSLAVEHRLWDMWDSVVAARGLQSTGKIVAMHGLNCPTTCGIFPYRDRTCVSCIGRQILYL